MARFIRIYNMDIVPINVSCNKYEFSILQFGPQELSIFAIDPKKETVY